MAQIKVKYILDIPKGRGRIFIGKDYNDRYMMLVGLSDNELESGKVNDTMTVIENDVNEYVLGIMLDNHEQAEAYSFAFDKLAKKMKEDQNESA